MKILFMGTPDFALFSLKALVENSNHSVIGVVTQPDKPSGRGYKLTPPPVKVYAEEKNIPVYQPNTLRTDDFAALLGEIDPECIVVVAFGKILPPNVLEYPRYGCVNVHGSLLPKYRGAAPMQRAIIDGEKITGITTMYMADGIDTGDMLDKAEVSIELSDNFETVHDKLGECGASLLLKTLEKIERGTAIRTVQNDADATYAAKITKEECKLSFDADALTIHNKIRGLSPFPLALTHTPDSKILKIVEAEIADEKAEHTNVGEVLSLDDGIEVACRQGSVRLLRVVPEGKSKMSAADYIRGRKIAVGDILLP
ncbi:MAG: methionyl-tRNA formyltransferase [Clostridia bacterium]|nr:methionyl-tRNA formyltransferase [Clostridia bacterium]